MLRSRSVALFMLALLFSAAQAQAHLKLARSSPAQGDTIREPLSKITLTFTQPVEEAFTAVDLIDSSGRSVGMRVVLQAVGGSPSRQYVVMLEHPIVAGAYTLKWRTAGQDGHAVSGMFDFAVDAVAGDSAPSASPSASRHPPEHGGHQAGATDVPALYNPETSIAWILARWVNFAGLIILVGAVAFRFFVLERSHLETAVTRDIDAAVRRLAVTAAAVTILANLARLWLQLGSLHGSNRMFEPDFIAALLIKGGWGRAWLAQTFAALGVLIAAAVKSEDLLDRWYSAAPFAVIAASTPAFSGHAAAVQQMAIVPILDDAVHVIASAAWLGTLAVLLIAAFPRVLRQDNAFANVATLIKTFSPLALIMAALTVMTGALNAFVHVKAFSELWTTSYGRILAVKIAVVIVTMTVGGYNWKVASPRLGTEAGTNHIRRSASGEIIIGLVIVLLTAVLVGTPV